jgi:hypothetical protein
LPEAAGFRKTRFFKAMVKETGVLRYWRERGFPRHCRPVGEDDFECDEIT